MRMANEDKQDEEKLVELLKEIGMLEIEDCLYTAEYLIAHGVTVREPQKPLQRGQLVDCGFFWLERKEEEELFPVVLKEGWEVFFVDFVGTDSFVPHGKADYGKTWRCWAEKPTEEERKAAEWE